jgi:hypothetical protein
MRRTAALCTLVAATVVALWTLAAGSPSAKTTAARGAAKLVTARGAALPGRWQAWAAA